jgi:hypothetical protein
MSAARKSQATPRKAVKQRRDDRLEIPPGFERAMEILRRIVEEGKAAGLESRR